MCESHGHLGGKGTQREAVVPECRPSSERKLGRPALPASEALADNTSGPAITVKDGLSDGPQSARDFLSGLTATWSDKVEAACGNGGILGKDGGEPAVVERERGDNGPVINIEWREVQTVPSAQSAPAVAQVSAPAAAPAQKRPEEPQQQPRPAPKQPGSHGKPAESSPQERILAAIERGQDKATLLVNLHRLCSMAGYLDVARLQRDMKYRAAIYAQVKKKAIEILGKDANKLPGWL